MLDSAACGSVHTFTTTAYGLYLLLARAGSSSSYYIMYSVHVCPAFRFDSFDSIRLSRRAPTLRALKELLPVHVPVKRFTGTGTGT